MSLNERDPRCEITTSANGASLPRRSMFRRLAFGWTSTHAPLHVDSNDVQTQVDGLQHRVCRKIPFSDKSSVDRGMLKDFEKHVMAWCEENLRPLQEIPDFRTWLEQTPYNGKRKLELAECYDRLDGGTPTEKQRRKIASFIKTENYPEYKHGRWINSRSDYFKAYSGPWFKAIEESVFAHHSFIKHVPVPERPDKIKSMMREGARYFASDYTSFEAHFHPLFMEACEGVLYKYMLSNFPEVSEVISKTIFGTNHGATRRGVSFRLKGRRMSGDMCTSLSNGFSNLMIWDFFAKKKGTIYDGFVEGDDGIFAIYKGDAPTVDEYKSLGFTIKIEQGDDPLKMGFCGILAGDGQNMRSPSDFLCSFGWTTDTSCTDHTAGCLLRAKALSAAWEMPHCPVIRAIADRALFLTREFSPKFIKDGYHQIPPSDLKLPTFAPTATTRLLFERSFHVSVEVQLDLERRIRDGESLECLVEHFLPHPDVCRFAWFNVY